MNLVFSFIIKAKITLPLILLAGHKANYSVLPEFLLLGVSDKYYEKNDFSKSGNLGIVFLSNHCRISQKFQDYLVDLKKIMDSTDNDFFVVSPNNESAIDPDDQAYSDLGDSFLEMKTRAKHKNYNFPYLYDGERQELTNALNVKITPSAFVFNKDRKLIYFGRIGVHEKVKSINELDFYKALMRDKLETTLIKTPLFGTKVRVADDIKTTEAKLKRYSQETVKLSVLEKRNIEFIRRIEIGKLKLIYIWANNDSQKRDNLITISNVHKIYRKRGLSVITICIESSDNVNLIKSELEKSQMSALNFLVEGKDFSPLTTLVPNSVKSITPLCVLVNNQNVIHHQIGKVENHILRRKIVDYLGQ